jgi:hypothetical protein
MRSVVPPTLIEHRRDLIVKPFARDRDGDFVSDKRAIERMPKREADDF